MDLKIICIAGNMGAGKDTVADIVLDSPRVEGNKTKIGMSAAIINVASYMFPLGGLVPCQDQAERKISRPELNGHTTRDVLRDIGDTARRFDRFVWLNAVLRNIDMATRANDVVLVTGIRMISEAVVMRMIGAYVVGVNSPWSVVDDVTVPTEREVNYIVNNMCHHVINNDGSLSDLKVKALEMMSFAHTRERYSNGAIFSDGPPFDRDEAVRQIERHMQLGTQGAV